MKKESKAIEDMKAKMKAEEQEELRKIMIQATNIMIKHGAEEIQATLKTKTHYLVCTIKVDPKPIDTLAN